MTPTTPQDQAGPDDTGSDTPDTVEPEGSHAITDRDLVFDCPHCGKNFVIDQNAAGRSFPCPECEREIEIPPLDVLLTEGPDADAPAGEGRENAEAHILQLQHELDQAHEEISTLKTEIEELRFRRRYLEKCKNEQARLIQDVNQNLDLMRTAVDQMSEALREAEKPARDTQQIG